MHTTEDLAEADRLMTICNACRYCEGLCAVFPAMEKRRSFAAADLRYLANLCHGCGACYEDCQFSPPHEFNVDVPRTLAKVRESSYATYAWPRALAPFFSHGIIAAFCMAALSIAIFLIWQTDQSAHGGAGSFYAVMPHGVMVSVFGTAFLLMILALAMGARSFWREGSSDSSDWRAFWAAAKDAMTLRYLDGGGKGCYGDTHRPNDHRRMFHHFTFYGFLLCFAATAVATVYHYLLAREAPYAWWDLPAVLGTAGGLGLLIGPVGLWLTRFSRGTTPMPHRATDTVFLVMLVLTSLTGFALLIARATSLMPVLLAVHLGVVLALFLSAPYGKFVHGLYRYLALTRYAQERRGTIA